jgi:hypothetical protein
MVTPFACQGDPALPSGHSAGSTHLLRTPDGRWLWDGEDWVKLPPRRLPPRLRRQRLAWLVSIVALWILTWWHSWSAAGVDLAIGCFSAASLLTIAFGGLLGARADERRILRSALVGVTVLGASSVLAIAAGFAIHDGIGEFLPAIAGVLAYGSLVIPGLSVIGFLYLALLLWVGARLSWLLARAGSGRRGFRRDVDVDAR